MLNEAYAVMYGLGVFFCYEQLVPTAWLPHGKQRSDILRIISVLVSLAGVVELLDKPERFQC